MKEFQQFVLLLFKLILFATIIAIFCWHWYPAAILSQAYPTTVFWLIAGLYGVLYLFFSNIYSSFKVGYYSLPEVFFNQTIAIVLTNGVMYIVSSLLIHDFFSFATTAKMLSLQLIIAFCWSFLANKYYFHITPRLKTLVIYQGSYAFTLLKKLGHYPRNFHFAEVCYLDNLNTGEIYEKIDHYPAVMLCYLQAKARNNLVKYCVLQKKQVYLTPKISDLLISGASRLHLLDTPLLQFQSTNQSIGYRITKRIIDFTIALTLIILTAPVMLITALVIHLHDKGPVLYSQKRLTRNKKVFKVYKFRSMVVGAEKDGVARLSAQNDDRITPVGKFIRATRIDELPQLFNVLSGQMSMVGPRPERPVIFREYCEKWPEFALRLQVKAGLTGYAQIFGKYNTTPLDKLQLDLMYIADHSIIQDFLILFLTIRTVFQKESTEGVAEDQHTADHNQN